MISNELDIVEVIKAWISSLNDPLITIRDRMNRGLLGQDELLENCISEMENAIKVLSETSDLPIIKDQIMVIEEVFKKLREAVMEIGKGIWDPRSIVGDNLLDWENIIQEIKKEIAY